jgi:4-aminobutyrate aminotransferase
MSKSGDLKIRKAAAVPAGVGSRGIYVAKAENSEIWDVDGRRYVDFAAGIAVLNTGHRHPRVMEAVAQQAQAFTHTCFHVAPYESYVRLAERLNALAPGDFAKKTLFLNSGAEAVENAIKIARYSTKRSAVIAFSGGFHGRTLMTMALTGKVMPYKRGFGPFPAEVYHAEFPQPYHGITTEQALADLDRLFHGDVDPKSVAAIIIEPVQGEGGFNVAPVDFLRALRRLCDEHGIVMIADEVQGGMGRTGKMFSIEHSGVVPDLMTLAKGLGGGFPLSAVTGRATMMDSAHAGGLGGTYGGNPISSAAAHRRYTGPGRHGGLRIGQGSEDQGTRRGIDRCHFDARRSARPDSAVMRHVGECRAPAGAADDSGCRPQRGVGDTWSSAARRLRQRVEARGGLRSGSVGVRYGL